MKSFFTNLINELKNVDYVTNKEVRHTTLHIVFFLFFSVVVIMGIDYLINAIRNVIMFL